MAGPMHIRRALHCTSEGAGESSGLDGLLTALISDL